MAIGASPLVHARNNALVSDPRLLPLDETSASVSHEETRELMDDIPAARKRLPGHTIVIIEHEMSVIERITGRCAVLVDGRKICEGTCARGAADPQVQEADAGGQ
jgi:branched-chain amino acid transport system ATP-binding protein